MPAADYHRTGDALWGFAKRVLIAVAIAAAAYLLWRMRFTALMAFAAVIVAVLLLSLTDLLRRFLPLGQSWALAAAIIVVLLVLALMGWLIGAQVQSQIAEVWQRLPQGIETVEERLGIQLIGGGERGGADQQREQGRGADPPAGQGGTQAAQDSTTGRMAGRLASWATSFGFTVVDAVLSTLLAIIAGAYLAAQPALYRRGLTKLFPPNQHERISGTLSAMGAAMRGWLIGVLISMVIVGVLTGFGLWLIGVPAPLALGLFAGLTEFVPIIGPIIGAIPALLLALTEGGSTFLWTLLLFVVIQQVESNLIAPLVQRQMVSVPPALFVLAIAAFGALFGILGIVVAAPLLVVTYVAVKNLWVRDTLNEETPLLS